MKSVSNRTKGRKQSLPSTVSSKRRVRNDCLSKRGRVWKWKKLTLSQSSYLDRPTSVMYHIWGLGMVCRYYMTQIRYASRFLMIEESDGLGIFFQKMFCMMIFVVLLKFLWYFSDQSITVCLEGPCFTFYHSIAHKGFVYVYHLQTFVNVFSVLHLSQLILNWPCQTSKFLDVH